MNIEIALIILAAGTVLKFVVFAIKRFWPSSRPERRTDLKVIDIMANIGIVIGVGFISFWIIPFVIIGYVYYYLGFFNS